MFSSSSSSCSKQSSSSIRILSLFGFACLLVFVQVHRSLYDVAFVDITEKEKEQNGSSSSSSSASFLSSTPSAKESPFQNMTAPTRKTINNESVEKVSKTTTTTTTTPSSAGTEIDVVAPTAATNNNHIFNNITTTLYPTMMESQQQQQQIQIERRLEFVHIPKTGGTTIENVAALHNVSWGVCNFVSRKASKEKFGLPNGCAKDSTAISRESKWSKKFQTDGIKFPTRKQCKIGPVFWHLPSWLFDNIDNPQKYNPYFDSKLFAVVRNPYTRLISEYFYRRFQILTPKQLRNAPPSLSEEIQIMNQWIQERMKSLLLEYTTYTITTTKTTNPNANPFFMQNSNFCHFEGHFIPQYYFIYKPQQIIMQIQAGSSGSNNNTRRQQQQSRNLIKVVDHVLRFENIQQEFDSLMVLYGINFTLNDGGPSLYNMSTYYKSKYSIMGSINNLDETTKKIIEQVYSLDFELFNYTKLSNDSKNKT